MPDLLWLAAGLTLLTFVSGCESSQRTSGCRGFDLKEQLVDPFDGDAAITVLVFVSCDCPISNRYIPTLRSLQEQYAQEAIKFWLVYPDPDASTEQVEQHLREYKPQISVLRDPQQELVKAAGVTTVPEAAVFVREEGRWTRSYHGGIDNRYVDFGVARVQPTKFHLRDVLDLNLAGRQDAFPSIPAIGCPIPNLR